MPITSHGGWRAFSVVALVCAASAVLTLDYGVRTRLFDPGGQRVTTHHEIVAGTAPAPYRYRVLVPFLVQPFVGSATRRDPVAFDGVFAVYTFLTLAAFLLLLIALLRTWFDNTTALAGALLAAALLPIALRDHDFQPWTWLEGCFFALAMIAAVRRWPPAAFVVLTIVATLNRETGLIVSLIALAAGFDFTRWRVVDRRLITAAALSAVAWMATYGTLRLVRGSAPSVKSIHEIWQINTATGAVDMAIGHATLLLAAPCLVALVAFALRQVPSPVGRILLVVVPPYAVLVAVFGVWREARLLVPLLPLVLPATMSVFSTHSRSEPTNDENPTLAVSAPDA